MTVNNREEFQKLISFNDKVEEIESNMLLQKLSQKEREQFFDAAFDVLRETGTMRVIVPYFKSTAAFTDPELQLPFFTEASFMKYAEKWDQKGFFMFAEETWMLKSDEAKDFAIKHYWDVVSAFVIDFKKKNKE